MHKKSRIVKIQIKTMNSTQDRIIVTGHFISKTKMLSFF